MMPFSPISADLLLPSPPPPSPLPLILVWSNRNSHFAACRQRTGRVRRITPKEGKGGKEERGRRNANKHRSVKKKKANCPCIKRRRNCSCASAAGEEEARFGVGKAHQPQPVVRSPLGISFRPRPSLISSGKPMTNFSAKRIFLKGGG